MVDSYSSLGLPEAFRPLVRLYLLRILVKLGGHCHVMDERRVLDPDLFQDLGIALPSPELPYRPDLLYVRLRRRMLDLEHKALVAPADATLTHNLRWLAEILDLTPLEADIVLFLAIVHHVSVLRVLLEKFSSIRTHEVHAVLAAVIGHPPEAVSQALSHTSRLVKSGLVWSNLSSQWNFTQKVGLLEGVADQLTLPQADPFHLFLSNFRRSAPATLGLQDFTHLGADLRVLVPYLREALCSPHRGVNILIYGPPGTGKTELVRTVAQELGAPLFEIAAENRYGDAYDGRARFGAFQLAQGVLGGDPRPIVLFDEVEDVFRPSDDDRARSGHGSHTGRKAWINQQLQDNRTPAFWVCNTIWGMDSAFLRRFDFVVEIKVPPRSVRHRILEQHTADLPVSMAWVNETAEHEHLTPAAIERAAKVARAVMGATPGLSADEVISRVLGNSLEAMGASRRPRSFAQTATTYRLDVLNANRDLVVVLEGLKRTGAARACLYGPSGTGKTAFAHHVAEVLDKPLIVKRASDLQSKWLGETEQNLAHMFEEAAQESAVLLLDEADSFLGDRQGAQRSWEVSQVNELLTQLETFEGVFIASTNLMDTLDQAAIRRFDLKIRFDYMAPGQREVLFRDCMATLGLTVDVESLGVVAGLSRLTPGDYANVMRQDHLDPITSGVIFAERLVLECNLKAGGPRRSIGF
jgi:SpoVK/Ycf46/Vps4 family AAA+-type ATPase